MIIKKLINTFSVLKINMLVGIVNKFVENNYDTLKKIYNLKKKII